MSYNFDHDIDIDIDSIYIDIDEKVARKHNVSRKAMVKYANLITKSVWGHFGIGMPWDK